MIDNDKIPLRELLINAKGRPWINGREPSDRRLRGTDAEVLCIRITERDRARLERAITVEKKMSTTLKAQFTEAMFDLWRRAKTEANYNAPRFLQMIVEQGAVPTAKQLVNSPKMHSGLVVMQERARLDLTVEAEVLNPRWKKLFTVEDLSNAKKKLDALDYKPASAAEA